MGAEAGAQVKPQGALSSPTAPSCSQLSPWHCSCPQPARSGCCQAGGSASCFPCTLVEQHWLETCEKLRSRLWPSEPAPAFDPEAQKHPVSSPASPQTSTYNPHTCFKSASILFPCILFHFA